MSTEKSIMIAITKADLFLVTAWKYVFILLLLCGIGAIIALNKK